MSYFSLSMSVCSHVSKTTCPNFVKCFVSHIVTHTAVECWVFTGVRLFFNDISKTDERGSPNLTYSTGVPRQVLETHLFWGRESRKHCQLGLLLVSLLSDMGARYCDLHVYV